jgi:predicted cupin superfamily sugar epimerase
MTADEIIATLGLAPHPEGGHFRETWRADNDGRPAGTAIYFLLQRGEVNRWHRVDATEIWHFHAGAPLVLRVSETDAGPATRHVLGPDLAAGQRPQVIVPAHHWQRAECTGAHTLAGCTVSPGFRFEGFTLAAPDFDIPDGD